MSDNIMNTKPIRGIQWYKQSNRKCKETGDGKHYASVKDGNIIFCVFCKMNLGKSVVIE